MLLSTRPYDRYDLDAVLVMSRNRPICVKGIWSMVCSCPRRFLCVGPATEERFPMLCIRVVENVDSTRIQFTLVSTLKLSCMSRCSSSFIDELRQKRTAKHCDPSATVVQAAVTTAHALCSLCLQVCGVYNEFAYGRLLPDHIRSTRHFVPSQKLLSCSGCQRGK